MTTHIDDFVWSTKDKNCHIIILKIDKRVWYLPGTVPTNQKRSYLPN